MTDRTFDPSHPTTDSLTERKKIVTVGLEKVNTVDQVLPPLADGSLRKLENYSDINKVFRLTYYLYRFIYYRLGAERFAKWLGYGIADKEGLCKVAQERWIRAVQQDHYAVEVKFCRNQPKVIPSGMKVASSRVQQLGLFLDEHGILRVNTRLQHAQIARGAKEPMLLPKHSHLTVLLVRRAHKGLLHAGVAQTLAVLKENYWIPQGRQAVRNILRQCVKCRMAQAAPYPILAPPPLPDFRVQRVEVFECTGVDFAGPMHLSVAQPRKRGKNNIQEVKKRKDLERAERLVYLIIFTCAVTRNVHAEVLDGMSVTDFMHGLRRFASKYGPPAMFYSDNAKTFECAGRELRQVLASPKLRKYLFEKEITWNFYVQRAPWMGGFIERVVGLYKCAIKRVVGRAKLDFQEFVTLISETTAVLNSRPITYVYDTVSEEEPVTPSRLWCGRNITLFPPFYETRIDRKDPEICKKRLKYLDKVLTHFWNRFSSQYLSSLSERHLSKNLPRDGRQPKVGEVVLIKNDILPRGRWKIARIVNVTPGPDGVVRRVELQPPYLNLTPDMKKNKLSETMFRPPRLLVPLECEVDKVNLDDQEDV